MNVLKSVIAVFLSLQFALPNAALAANQRPSVDASEVERQLQVMPIEEMTDAQIRQGLSELRLALVQLEDEVESAEARNDYNLVKNGRKVTLTIAGLSILVFILGGRAIESGRGGPLAYMSMPSGIVFFLNLIPLLTFATPQPEAAALSKKYDVKLSRKEVALLRNRIKIMRARISAIETRLSPVTIKGQ
ncbi:MAG TPA: hypothetical protein VM432_11090 [Bdellovibrionales bacterium]|jgi:hypothetical protein|nr:hypothetical protein [Bdellovibrionales bacterium]